MAANEGVKRIKTIGRTLVLGGAVSALVLAVCMEVLRVYSLAATPLLPLVFFLLLAGGMIWVGGWVLEGFFGARKREQPDVGRQ